MNSSSTNQYTDVENKLQAIRNKVKNFDEMLSGIKKIDGKKKALWREIYENALNDRENASILFTEAYVAMKKTVEEHILVGGTMTKYLERMHKSNEQILRVAELISKIEDAELNIDSDAIFKQIKEND